MSDITSEDFENLELLARIRCTENEKQDILASLKTILDYVEQLQQIPTDHVEICCHPTLDALQEVFREDFPEKNLDRKTFLNNAPDKIGGMIRTPPVITEEP